MKKAYCDNCGMLVTDEDIQNHMILGHSIMIGTTKESEEELMKRICPLCEHITYPITNWAPDYQGPEGTPWICSNSSCENGKEFRV